MTSRPSPMAMIDLDDSDIEEYPKITRKKKTAKPELFYEKKKVSCPDKGLDLLERSNFDNISHVFCNSNSLLWFWLSTFSTFRRNHPIEKEKKLKTFHSVPPSAGAGTRLNFEGLRIGMESGSNALILFTPSLKSETVKELNGKKKENLKARMRNMYLNQKRGMNLLGSTSYQFAKLKHHVDNYEHKKLDTIELFLYAAVWSRACKVCLHRLLEACSRDPALALKTFNEGITRMADSASPPKVTKSETNFWISQIAEHLEATRTRFQRGMLDNIRVADPSDKYSSDSETVESP